MKKIVSVYGPTSVGKTTITRELVKKLGVDTCTRISLDKYLKNKDKCIDRLTFLNSDPVDWKLVEKHIFSKVGTMVRRPKYDHDTYTRLGPDESDSTFIRELIIIDGAWPYVKADLKIQLELDKHARLKRLILRYFNEWGKKGDVWVKFATENWDDLPGYYPDIKPDLTVNTVGNLDENINLILQLLK